MNIRFVGGPADGGLITVDGRPTSYYFSAKSYTKPTTIVPQASDLVNVPNKKHRYEILKFEKDTGTHIFSYRGLI